MAARRPLGHDLLLSRSSALLATLTEASSPPRGAILSRILCDGCGVLVDLTRERWPEGWTTAGDFEHGFDDRCGECSR
jgi:hypothetical protein